MTRSLLGIVVIATLLIGPGALAAPVRSDQAPSAPPQPMLRLAVTPERAAVLDTVTLTADGLPPDRPVVVEWHTVTGGWQIADYYKFLGKRYEPTVHTWGEARTDASGRLETTLTVPEDYGGVHEVVARVGDGAVARGAVEVVQSFAISSTEGPVGSPIEITARGIGWRTIESTWVVTWDNQSIGWLSAADTRGTAIARFRAAGPPGEHYIKAWSGFQGLAYLNPQQAPTAYLPRPDWLFTTTGEPEELLSFVEPYPDQREFGLLAIGGESSVVVSPVQGPIETPSVLSGRGLPPGTDVSVRWERMEGNRVFTGWEPEALSLGTARVADDGTLRFAFTVPDDLGGAHPIRLVADGRELASTVFVVETSLVSVTPSVVRRNQPFEIQLKGVGWTEYDNILNVTYDNAYFGYVCGFSSQGDVLLRLTATGAAGVHLIDLYPGIYTGPAELPQQLYRLPQLTYREDHPGNRLPAIRVSILVVDEVD